MGVLSFVDLLALLLELKMLIPKGGETRNGDASR